MQTSAYLAPVINYFFRNSRMALKAAVLIQRELQEIQFQKMPRSPIKEFGM